MLPRPHTPPPKLFKFCSDRAPSRTTMSILKVQSFTLATKVWRARNVKQCMLQGPLRDISEGSVKGQRRSRNSELIILARVNSPLAVGSFRNPHTYRNKYFQSNDVTCYYFKEIQSRNWLMIVWNHCVTWPNLRGKNSRILPKDSRKITKIIGNGSILSKITINSSRFLKLVRAGNFRIL